MRMFKYCVHDVGQQLTSNSAQWISISVLLFGVRLWLARTIVWQQQSKWFEISRRWGLSVYLRLHGFPLYRDFLPQSNGMHIQLIANLKLSLGVSVDGCFDMLGWFTLTPGQLGLTPASPVTASAGEAVIKKVNGWMNEGLHAFKQMLPPIQNV